MSDSMLSKKITELVVSYGVIFVLLDNWIPVAEKLSSISPEERFLT
jgi:hypothetical protein